MPDTTANLGLPFILPAQAQKHVTHNEALLRLDVLVQAAVQDRSRTAPPTDPIEGQCHLIAPAATGVWSGHDGQIAAFLLGGWVFFPPRPGWRARVLEEDLEVFYTSSGWQDGADMVLQARGLGLNATADLVNRLVVSAPATLLNHDGAGHQVKVNKAAVVDTASLLFQTGFSGRAEMGLSGNDDFSVKVSADGSTWATGLTLTASNGQAVLPNGAQVTGQITGTAVTQTARDTTAGRLVKVGDYGLGGAQALAGSTSLQALDLPPGNYSYATGGTLTGGPETATWPHALQVIEISAATTATTRRRMFISARVTSALATCRVWVGFNQGTNPIIWTPLPVGNFLVGTVGQSGGLPTGSAFESMSNANGEYIRFADGTQICMTTIALVSTGEVSWTYPAAFASTPRQFAGANGGTVAFCRTTLQSATGLQVSGYNTAGARVNGFAAAIAFGRWF